jgi:hypothetical protein
LILNLFAFFPFRLFPLVFLTPFLGLFAAEFPDNTAGAELAVNAGVGAGPAGIQALLAVAEFMLLALHASFPLRVKTACIHTVIIAISLLNVTHDIYNLLKLSVYLTKNQKPKNEKRYFRLSRQRCILCWKTLLPGVVL